MTDYAALKKGGFMRQKQKNLFSLRLRSVGGQLTARQLARVAAVAEKYGKGYVHLTSRQGVEIPFIRLEQIDEVKAELAAGGVVPGVCGPRVRTVTACQGNTVCPSACIDTQRLAQKLDKRYFGRNLPHKFKFGVTGCQNNCLKAEENDLGVKGGLRVTWLAEKCIHCGLCLKICRSGAISEAADGSLSIYREKCNYCGRCAKACPSDAYDAQEGYIVSFGGVFGNHIHQGEQVIPFIEDEEKLLRVCDAAINYFAEHAQSGERFKFTLDRMGRESFATAIKEAYNG